VHSIIALPSDEEIFFLPLPFEHMPATLILNYCTYNGAARKSGTSTDPFALRANTHTRQQTCAAQIREVDLREVIEKNLSSCVPFRELAMFTNLVIIPQNN
jgi:hypothetical protein